MIRIKCKTDFRFTIDLWNDAENHIEECLVATGNLDIARIR
jgi:hypothetical protein